MSQVKFWVFSIWCCFKVHQRLGDLQIYCANEVTMGSKFDVSIQGFKEVQHDVLIPGQN